MSYDDSNVFAKILRGELPAHKVYETDRVLAFMDIMPRAGWPCARDSESR
jgi:histidine triad (HIT) family protein